MRATPSPSSSSFLGSILALLIAGGGVLTLGARQAPAPALDRAAERWVAQTLRAMTLDDKIGQLLVPGFDTYFTSAGSDRFVRLAKLVTDLRVGGFVLFGQRSRPVPGVLLNQAYGAVDLADPFDAASLVNRLQALAKVPLLNAADVETGMGMRFRGATAFPRAMAFGAAGDPQLAFEAGRITALEGRAMGIQVSFAPVADVNNNARNPVINTRSFGEDPGRVGELASAFARGLAAGGMIATVKHFPGHGDTDVDSHLGLPVIDQSRERLEQVELKPFRMAFEAGAAAVMVAHIESSALDPEPGSPATLSRRVVSGLLRDELGFGGLAYTDSMSMQAVAKMLPPGVAAVRAIAAGNDVIVESPDDEAAFRALKEAVGDGTLELARVEASVRRVLEAKARLRLHAARAISLDALPEVVGAPAHEAVADEVARRAVTLIKDDRQHVPLVLPGGAQVLYLSVLDYPGAWGIAAPSRVLRPELQRRWPNVTAIELSDRSTPSELELVRAMAPRFDAVVAGVFVRASSGSGRMDLAPAVVRLLQAIARSSEAADQPFVTVFFGNPYVPTGLPELPAMLLTYDFHDRAELAAVRALAGEAPITGRLPVTLPGLFPVGHGLDRPAR